MFTPTLLSETSYSISPRTQANTARAELMVARMEDKALVGDMSYALRRSLARLEAISTIRIEGKLPHLRSILFLEAFLDEHDGLGDEWLSSTDALDFESESHRETALEVIRYVQTLERIYRVQQEPRLFTAKSLLNIHSIALYGKSADETGVGFRGRPFLLAGDEAASGVYRPPDPEDIPALIEDLCAFINQELYAPTTQAAIAHFQLESIKPFKSGMDKTGRLMCHAIIHRRELARAIVTPIGLEPAIDTKSHAESLLPYHFGVDVANENLAAHLDRWADFCAWSAEVSVRAADVYLDALLKLKDEWIERFGRPNKNSAAEALLSLLPGVPVLTANQAIRLTGKSATAVYDALARLERAGIVEALDTSQRNRVYSAPQAVSLFEQLGQRIVPEKPTARESFFPGFSVS